MNVKVVMGSVLPILFGLIGLVVGQLEPSTSQDGKVGLPVFMQAIANIESGHVHGKILFEQASTTAPVSIHGVLLYLPEGAHSVIIYDSGNTGDPHDCSNLGDHFNPLNKNHGAPYEEDHHAGDLGNIESYRSPNVLTASLSLTSMSISLIPTDPKSILNRTIAVHEYVDDFKGGRLGNALGCGTIMPVQAGIPGIPELPAGSTLQKPVVGIPQIAFDASGSPYVIYGPIGPATSAGVQPTYRTAAVSLPTPPPTLPGRQAVSGTFTGIHANQGTYGTTSSIYPTGTGQDMYGPQTTGQGMYGPQATGQGMYGPQATGQGMYRPQATGQGMYRPQATGQGMYGPQATGQGMYGPQATGQGMYGPPGQGMYGPPGQGIYSKSRAGQSMYDPLNTGQGIYNQPRTGQSMYDPRSTGQGAYSQQGIGQGVYGQQNIGRNMYGQPNFGQNMYGTAGRVQPMYGASNAGFGTSGVTQGFTQAVATIASGPVTGKILFSQPSSSSPVYVQGVVLNLPEGSHGVTIYESINQGNVNDCSNLGGLFNPTNANHGSPDQPEHHVGDLGNIESVRTPNGLMAVLNDPLTSANLQVRDPSSILQRTIAIHQYPDDFRGGSMGNVLVCATITPSDASPQTGSNLQRQLLGTPQVALDASGIPYVTLVSMGPATADGAQSRQLPVNPLSLPQRKPTSQDMYGTTGTRPLANQETGQGMYGVPSTVSSIFNPVGTGSQISVSQPISGIRGTTGGVNGMYGKPLAASIPVTEIDSTPLDLEADIEVPSGILIPTRQYPYDSTSPMSYAQQNPYTGASAGTGGMYSGSQYPYTGSSIGSLGRGWESPFDPSKFPGNRFPGSAASTAYDPFNVGTSDFKRSLEYPWQNRPLSYEVDTNWGVTKPAETGNIWKAGNVYEYQYSGYMASGMPAISPQFAGASIEGKLTVEPRDEQTLVVRFSELTARVFNENVMEEFEARLGKEVPVQDKMYLEKPITVTIVSGNIQSVSVGTDEPLWVINFKRGVVAQLQLQLDQAAGIFQEYSDSEENYGAGSVLYPVKEGGSTGDCETWYSISRLTEEQINTQPELLPSPELCQGKATYEIFKTKNLDKCDKTPVSNYISPGYITCRPDAASCENFFSHSDMTRVIGCTTEDGSLVVQKIMAVDKLVIKPYFYETEPIVGSATQRFELTNVRPTGPSSTGTRLPPRAGERTLNTLVFAFDEDMYDSGPYMKQPSLKTINSPWTVDPKTDLLKGEARRLIQELVKTMESEDFYATPNMYGAPDKYNMLRNVLMFLDYDDLKPLVVSMVDSKGNSAARQIVLDALVGAGTNPALLILQELILKGVLEGEEAYQAISLLPFVVKTPTKELFESFIDFLSSDVVDQDFQLKVTTALAVSKLFHQACVNTTIAKNRYPVTVMGEFCNPNDDFFTRKLLPYLADSLHNADDLGEQTAMLTALRNIGHEAVIPIIAPYILHCDPSLEDSEGYRKRRESVSKSKFKLGYEEEKETGESWEEAEPEDDEREGRGQKSPAGKKSSKYAKTVAKESKAERKIAAQRRQQDLEFKRLEAAEALRQKQESQTAKFAKKKAKVLKKAQDEEFLADAAATPLKEKDSCTILRVTAIYALKQFVFDGNSKVSGLLLPIYNNKAEDPEVRIAAIHNIIMGDPPIGVFQKLAVSTWFEPSPLVSSFIYHVLKSLTNFDNPTARTFSKKAEAVMALVKPHTFWNAHESMTHMYGDYSERTRLGYAFGYANVPSQRSFMPSYVFNRLFTTAGPVIRQVYEIMIQGNQLEKFIDMYLGEPAVRNQKGLFSEFFNLGGSFAPSDGYSGSQQSGKSAQVPYSAQYSETLEKIRQELQIEPRAKASPELTVSLNYMNAIQRFFYIDESTFQQAIQNIIKSVVTGGSGLTFNYFKWLPTADSFVRIPSGMGLSYASYTHFKVLAAAKGQFQGSFSLHGSSDFKAIVKPLISMKRMTKIGLEVPFTTVMPQAGVDFSLNAALPGKFGVKADYSQSQLITTWEPIGNKQLHLFHRKVQPFTGVKNINDFTPIILHPDSKPIVLLESPIEQREEFGEEESGLKMYSLSRGDIQGIEDPFPFVKDFMGHLLFWANPSTLRAHENVLVLDLAASSTNQIRTTFAMHFQSKSGPEVKVDMYGRRITSPSVGLTLTPGNRPGDVVLPSGRIRVPVDLKPITLTQYVSGLFGVDAPQWTSSKFQKVLDPMQSGSGVSIDTTIEFLGSATPRRYGSSLTTGYGDLGSQSRFNWRAKRLLSGDNNYEICICGDWKWPQMNIVNREQLFRADLSTFVNLSVRFGAGDCEQNPSISVKGKFSRSSDQQTSSQTQYMHTKCAQDEARGWHTSLHCMQSRRIATTLNKYDLDIKYQQVPETFQNLTNKVANAIRYWYVPYLSENVNVQNAPNQMRVEMTVYTLLGTMNVHTFKPHSNTFYDNIRIHPLAQTLVPISVKISPLSHQYSPAGMCLLDKDQVVTFDGLPYNVSLSGCNYLLTKDCSGRYRFAVLVREEMGKKVATMLLDDQKLELNPYMNRVKVNEGEERSVSGSDSYELKDKQGLTLASVRVTVDNYLQVTAPQHWITITLNPEQITIMGAMVHHGRLCGLCGSQNGERNDDLRGPRGCALPAEYMDEAYRLDTPSASCRAAGSTGGMLSSLRDMQNTCQSQVSLQKPYNFALAGFGYVQRNEATEKCTSYRNEMQEIEGLQCFSLVPLPKCSSQCRPTGVTQQRVNFHCMPSNQLSNYLQSEGQRRTLDELHGKPTHKIVTFQVPVGCQ